MNIVMEENVVIPFYTAFKSGGKLNLQESRVYTYKLVEVESSPPQYELRVQDSAFDDQYKFKVTLPRYILSDDKLLALMQFKNFVNRIRDDVREKDRRIFGRKRYSDDTPFIGAGVIQEHFPSEFVNEFVAEKAEDE